MKLGNGLWESAKFNTRLQLTELALGHSVNEGSLWKAGYEYGEIESNGTLNTAKNTGNIAKQTISFNGLAQPLVQTYKYDSLYRLKESKEMSGANQTWIQQLDYDRFGNRQRTGSYQKIGAVVSVQDSKTFPTINQADNRFNAGQGYIYDKNGNVRADVDSAYSQARDFIFDGENKQTEVKQNGVTIGKYFYDGQGKRVKKITDLETTVFVYSAGKLIAEYSTAAPPSNPTTSYTATDQLGSPRVITDSFGAVISRRDFMPFGEEIYPDGTNRTTNQKYGATDSVRQRFTGYQKDVETGLDFAEARMYNNLHGRFTAIDPLLASGKSANPQTFNRYSYVMNSPLRFTDPTGLQAGDYKGNIYTNADETSFVAKPQTGYKQYKGDPKNKVGEDGYNYTVRSNGWTQGPKVDPNLLEGSAQAVSDTVLGGGGTVYNGFAGIVNGINWGTNSLINLGGGSAETFGSLPYYEFRTPGEQSASLATTILSFAYGGFSSAGRSAPTFAGFSTTSNSMLSGSGPVAGVLEVSNNVKSVGAFQNYSPKTGTIEFVFDTKNNIFAVGKPQNRLGFRGSPHQNLASSIGADDANVVGGVFRRGTNREIITNESSGHYWMNWTQLRREQFTNYMQRRTGQQVIHNR